MCGLFLSSDGLLSKTWVSKLKGTRETVWWIPAETSSTSRFVVIYLWEQGVSTVGLDGNDVVDLSSVKIFWSKLICYPSVAVWLLLISQWLPVFSCSWRWAWDMEGKLINQHTTRNWWWIHWNTALHSCCISLHFRSLTPVFVYSYIIKSGDFSPKFPPSGCKLWTSDVAISSD